MQKALAALPCVEPNSITTDVSIQQARFTVKDKSECSMQEVTKAIEEVGFTVSGVTVK
ncbi:MAG TPA: hypothetical protein VKU02_02735 [Gemmataceae bacterium]|nr:hypothetical protein [Gemmataceae bacterium]